MSDDFVIVMVGAPTGNVAIAENPMATKGILPALLNQNMWRFFPNSHDDSQQISSNLLVKNLPLW